MNNKKIIIITSTVIITVALSIYFFKKNHHEKKALFETSTPIRKDLTQYVNASGTLSAKDEITIGSLDAGRVVEIKADDNDFVKKDQVLVILDDGINYSAVKKFKAVVDEANANLEYYKNFYARQTELYKANQISQDQFEQYTQQLKVLEARVIQAIGELEMRQQEYDNLFIKSPADGVVIAKEVNLGQMITSRFQATVLYKIAKDLHHMEAKVDVDEADVGLVKDGQEATFTVDAFPKLKFTAKVEQIRYLAKIVDNVVTYATILDVDNPDLTLRPGMTTNVNIKVKESKNALCVKNKSLRINSLVLENVAKKLDFEFIRIPDTDAKTEIDHVWVLDNNKFKQIAVEIGSKHGTYSEIISKEIDDNSLILTSVEDTERNNDMLEQIFNKPGSIGSKKK
ncbi:efflux RND transporter periplasmic adaptor subunit [Candidatus Dependentiae bacterium]|nr:efflux RND transporter periplasmic adaptor subunit [Candidatus Dependentiae bacterium]MBU4386989.1 efflux RND transporter periplasmic adaptor subunit [Candidatus Dependentiae bacterium]MCG2756115.1 efflux RND transporter periplasmic adaptor subunit [Candidatus Dependentiae bacterium]